MGVRIHFTSQPTRAIDTVPCISRIAKAVERTGCVGAICVRVAVMGRRSTFVDICRKSGNEYSAWSFKKNCFERYLAE